MEPTPNPFLTDVFPERLTEISQGTVGVPSSVGSLHTDGLSALGGHLDEILHSVPVVVGGIILLRSQRAGFGKTHLLARMIESRGGKLRFVPLDVSRDSHPSWGGWLQGVLQICSQAGTGSVRVSFLEQLGRKLLAEASADLILRGDVPATDPASAIAMLKRDYIAAFDMSNGGSDVGRWLAGNFKALLPLMGEVLGSRCHVDVDEVTAWLRVLSSYNAGSRVERKTILNSVTLIGDEAYAEGGAKQRLRSFCRLAALHQPMVFVFDHVDSLMGAKKDAVQFACMLGELCQQHFGVGTVLSINNDVWSSSFESNLPSATLDRLTARQVKLGGIGAPSATELLSLRLSGIGADPATVERFFRRAKLEDVHERRWAGVAMPREVLRHGARVWEKMGTARECSTEESVKDYLPEELPSASSLAEPATLEPVTEVASTGTKIMEPPKVDPATVKQMGNISSLLRELRSRQEQFVPRDDLPAQPAKLLPEGDDQDRGEVTPVVARFEEIRSSLLEKKGSHLDLDALRRMVTLAGERFPMVESSEFKMTPGEEPTVMKWVFPGNEILFGFEPEHQFRFWQSLIKLAARRSGSATTQRVKLVIFSENGRPFSGAASIDEEEMAAARAECLDLVDLDAEMVVSVTAADRVVSEMAKAEIPVLPVDAIRELAPQLDPLWRRITRPMLAAKKTGNQT